MAYGDPPKRNYNPRAGAKKKIRPSFSANTSGPQSGLGPAYNSSKDPRGADAYVPVPESRASSQHPRTQSGHSKPDINGRYHADAEFLSYKTGSGEKPLKKPRGKVRRRTGDGWIG